DAVLVLIVLTAHFPEDHAGVLGASESAHEDLERGAAAVGAPHRVNEGVKLKANRELLRVVEQLAQVQGGPGEGAAVAHRSLDPSGEPAVVSFRKGVAEQVEDEIGFLGVD